MSFYSWELRLKEVRGHSEDHKEAELVFCLRSNTLIQTLLDAPLCFSRIPSKQPKAAYFPWDEP